MKRIIYILIVLVSISASIQAQSNKKVEFIALGGFNFCNQEFSYRDISYSSTSNAKLAYNFGAGAKFYLFNKFSLEVDILYKSKKSGLLVFSGLESWEIFHKFQYLAFPVLAHYRFPISKFNIFATFGLETDFLLKSQVEDKGNDIITEPIPNANRLDFQLISGLGIRYKPLSFEFRYGLGLLNLNSVIGSNLIVKNRGIEFLIGYHF